jgi:phosphatidylglycerol lysyltransferase
MEAMFIEIMLWGQAEGYRRFNLGMAPLSGLSTHPLAPLWHKLATRIFHRGESFYNFQGLRGYKEKFGPEWEPRYIAVPGTWSLPTALLDATMLIGGGLRKTLGAGNS